MKISKRNIFRIVWFSFVGIFTIWQYSTFQSRNLPVNTFLDSAKVAVTVSDDEIKFMSLNTDKTLEVIFFQGGLTDPKAYAPLCRNIAEQGYTSHLIKMSLRLPIRDYKKIAHLFNLTSSKYVIGGHSQGGKMAAQFVYENPKLMKGLFLMGTSHPRDIDLSNLSIPTIKLYGENDGLASVGEVLENKAKLPENTQLIFIKGGNHSQFGYLGKLLGDQKATISVEQQQTIAAESLIGLLNTIEND